MSPWDIWHPNTSKKLHYAKFPKRVPYLHVAKSILGHLIQGTKIWGGHISGTFVVIRTIPEMATSIYTLVQKIPLYYCYTLIDWIGFTKNDYTMLPNYVRVDSQNSRNQISCVTLDHTLYLIK